MFRMSQKVIRQMWGIRMKQIKPNLKKEYSKGAYNKVDQEEQWIRISEGCPNACAFCRESFENGKGEIYYDIPEIKRNKVKIMDMNLTAKNQFIDIANHLGNCKANNKVVYYELICGIDYRYMNQARANALKNNRFVNIRLAWDHALQEQRKIKSCIQMLLKAGYSPKEITIFMICNWLTPYNHNLIKLDLCKVWSVKVADCYFDNQLSPNIKPIHWSLNEIKDFRRRVRKHNQIINFGIDPEFDCNNKTISAYLSQIKKEEK
jgi:hypothetical protein